MGPFARRFKLEYVQPALTMGKAYSNDRPILTVFFAILFAFSMLPILAFLGIVPFTIVSFTLIGLVVAFIASVAVILCLSAILASILLVAFFASAFFTFVVISIYLLFRLFVLVRKDGATGVSGWACEIKSHIHKSAYAQAQDDRSDTNESVVVVHHDESDSDVKVQG